MTTTNPKSNSTEHTYIMESYKFLKSLSKLQKLYNKLFYCFHWTLEYPVCTVLHHIQFTTFLKRLY